MSFLIRIFATLEPVIIFPPLDSIYFAMAIGRLTKPPFTTLLALCTDFWFIYRKSLRERMEVADLEPVKTFLSAKSRTSKNTSKSYLTALRIFNKFLYPDTVEKILQPIIKGEKDAYRILDLFVGYMTKSGVPTTTQHFYMAAIKSFLGYHDIDVVPRIFKKKVGMPKMFREDEQAIDASDIRKILLKCNRR